MLHLLQEPQETFATTTSKRATTAGLHLDEIQVAAQVGILHVIVVVVVQDWWSKPSPEKEIAAKATPVSLAHATNRNSRTGLVPIALNTMHHTEHTGFALIAGTPAAAQIPSPTQMHPDATVSLMSSTSPSHSPATQL